MEELSKEQLQEVLSAFDFGSPVVGAMRYGKGHINDTFCVHTQPEDECCKCFILQRMSASAFKHPHEVMKNIIGITEYLGKKVSESGGDRSREVLEVIRPRNGNDYYTDSQGYAWRVFPFVIGTYCYQTAETPELFQASAKAFGRFQMLLKDYPADTLFETIPHFHDTEDRLNKLKLSIETAPAELLALCQPEITFVLEREKDCSIVLQAQRNGILPLRANHNAEDEKDLSKVNFDIDLYRVYTKGFLEGTSGCLTQEELDYLPWGAKLMTLECGIRFLTDFLQGNVYFRTSYPDQNLDRCRTQFKLVADMEQQFEKMHTIVQEYSHNA